MRKRVIIQILILIFVLGLSLFLINCEEDDSESANEDDSSGNDDDSADDDSADDDANDDDDADNDDDDMTDDEYKQVLIKKFQPLLIQKLAENYESLTYPMSSDLLGEISLHIGYEDYPYEVQVDTGTPLMYSDARVVEIKGAEHYQLLYAFFYPERPIPYTIEDNFLGYINKYIWSGLIDGKVIRITLDQDEQFPLTVEVARNCGCDWKLYVNRIVDNEARAEFEKESGTYPGLVKPNAPSDVTYVFLMPPDLLDAPQRVVFVAEDGWTQYPHNPLGTFTSYEQWYDSDLTINKGILYLPDDQNVEIFDAASLQTESFTRVPYDPLYLMKPSGEDQQVGIFDGFHHVWNSYSPLTKWMLDQCCFSKFPGTPKDKDHLEVVHETMDYWDVTLLFDTFIHLPKSLFGTDQ